MTTQTLENFSGQTLEDVEYISEAVGIPTAILMRFVQKVRQHHADEEYGSYALLPPDTAKVESIQAVVTDTAEVKVTIKPRS